MQQRGVELELPQLWDPFGGYQLFSLEKKETRVSQLLLSHLELLSQIPLFQLHSAVAVSAVAQRQR